MGILRPGDVAWATFETQTPSTSAATNADSLPTGRVYRNGVYDATVTVTVAQRTVSGVGVTGGYEASFTIPVGYAAGDIVSLVITAIMGGVTGLKTVASWVLDSKRVGDLHDVAAGAQMDLINAPNATALTAMATAVWAASGRTLSSFGTLVADVAAAVWAATGRTLSSIADSAGITTLLQHLPQAILFDGSGFVKSSPQTAGAGPYAVTVTLTDATGGAPLANVQVSLSQAGQILTQTTGSNGVAVFGATAGSWTLAMALPGYQATPQTVVVSGSQSLGVTMSRVVIPAATQPGQTNAYLYTYDASGAAAAAVTLTFALQSAPGQNSYGVTKTATSDGSGILQIPLLQNASYQARRGSGPWIPFTTGAGGTYPLPQILGDA